MTWAPGLPMMIRNRLSDGGWIARIGVTCFNLYRPPIIDPGDPASANPWLTHVRKVFPDDADHIVQWLAQRVQRPQEKINHALVLGGKQGIGKDTMLEPVKHAVGPWNFVEVSPRQVLGRFNGFVKSVVLRINEARDLGDLDRFQFYDHMKSYIAAPPDTLRVDERKICANTACSTAAASLSPPTTRPTESSCQVTIGGTSWLGPFSKRKTSAQITGPSSGLGTRTGVTAISGPISHNSISARSTRKPRRRRPPLSGISSTPTVHQRPRSWPTRSTVLGIPTPHRCLR